MATMKSRRKRISREGITEVQKVVIVAAAFLAGVALVAWILLSSFLSVMPNFPIGSGPGVEETDAPRLATIDGDEAIIEISTFNGIIILEPTSANEVNITVIKRGIGAGIDNIDIQFTKSTDHAIATRDGKALLVQPLKLT